MSPVEWAVVAAAISLKIMVISIMLRGVARRYPFVFTYAVEQLLASVILLSCTYYFGARSRFYARAYWTIDFVSTVLVLMIIVHLVRAAMERHRHREPVYWGLMLGVVVTAGVSLLLVGHHSGFSVFRWMTEVARDYYFAAVIINAVLWIMLVRSQHEDSQTYVVTSGLGLQLTGAAIGHALRVTGTLVALAGYIVTFTYLANLYIWYFAFKRLTREAVAVPAKTTAVPSPETHASSLRR